MRSAAKEFATSLAKMSDGVSRDVQAHQESIQAINSKLESATEQPKGELTDLVVGVVGELMRANQDLQAKLCSAEVELDRQTLEIENHLTKSLTDELTQLPNRRAFEDAMKATMRTWKEKLTPFTLIILDIDRFKQVNDTYGHIAGDMVLCNVASAIQKSVRQPDIVARLGGEEFVVLLPNTTLEDSQHAVRKILASVENSRTEVDGQELAVTVSAGLGAISKDEDSTSLLKRADIALYASKDGGRNCGHIHDGLQSIRIEQNTLEQQPTTDFPVNPAPSLTNLSADMQSLCEDLRAKTETWAGTSE